MDWEGGDESGNIEDRRGLGPVGIGGVGVGGVVLAVIGYLVFGVSPQSTLNVLQGAGPGPGGYEQQAQGVRGRPADQAGRFVDVIETSVDEVWRPIFDQNGRTYRPPAAVVLYDQATPTGCGLGQSAMGPFYCPQDQKVYLDLSFWRELSDRFGASGEAARAYVIAHEMGHHVQNLLGQAGEARELGARGAGSGSVRLELQADCYAGVWAAHVGEATGGKVTLTAQDIEDGARAAAAVGDDTLQRETQGQVVPDSFTHGTSAQRVRWLRKGYQTGNAAACDTFNAATL
ncbi:MAG: neutral zinc metallopeptidase [Proteobacteria bacterium]|nr:neutral zinc metallopeptidase [Pseudomonadota bacterium]